MRVSALISACKAGSRLCYVMTNQDTGVFSRRGAEAAAFAAILLFAAAVRFVLLGSIPPGLWYDEAIYALDALTIGHGNWPVFFTTEGHMREPLYIYSLAGAFSVFGHSTYVARVTTALWGLATVALFYPVARRMLGRNWALVAMLAFAGFRWHVHFSRTIFRAGLPPFFILGTLLFLLRWRERRRLPDAIVAGIMLGLGMYTYLSFRLVPVILLIWIVWLLVKGEIRWATDRRALLMAGAVAVLVFSPLLADYVFHPEHFAGRTDEISLFRARPEAAAGMSHKPVSAIVRDVSGNALAVAGMWTFRGDHVGKHNLPYAPVFDWASGIIFYCGLAWCVLNVFRCEAAVVCLCWLLVLCLTSVLSFGAPNLLRMQGASPAAILIYVMGLRWVDGILARRTGLAVRRMIIGALVACFLGTQLWTYFVRFPASPEVHKEFQTQTMYAPAESVRAIAPGMKTVFVPQEMAAHPTFAFVTAGVKNIALYLPDADVPTTAPRPFAFLITMRSASLAQAAGRDHSNALRRMPGARIAEEFPLNYRSEGSSTPAGKWAELWTVGDAGRRR